MEQDNLKQKVSKGLLWNTIHNLSMKGIQFLLMLFMARLLSPDDYGTVGLLAIFIQLSNTFAESGFSLALVRKQDRTQVDLSTAFYFNIVVGIICYFIVFCIAPWVAEFYNKPILKSLLRVLALTIPISSLSTVLVAMMNYNMQFKKQAMISITHTLVSGALGLAMAFMGYGVWALVGQSLIATCLGTVLCWLLNRWHPSWIYSWKSFHEMFGFSSKLLLTRIIDTIYGNVYSIVIGKVYSPATLGHYTRAQNWATMPSTNIVGILNNVSFASLSKIQDDIERLRSVYRKMIKTSAFIVFPLMFGLSAVSLPLIFFTIGTKWELCAQILQIICFMFVFMPIQSLNINLIQAMGRSDLSLKISVVGKVLSLLVLFGSLPFGIIPMCWFSVISSVVILLINFYYVGRLLGLSILNQLKDLFPSACLSAIMYIAVFFTIRLFVTDWIQLLAGIFVGMALYTGLAYVFKMKSLYDTIGVIKNMIHK